MGFLLRGAQILFLSIFEVHSCLHLNGNTDVALPYMKKAPFLGVTVAAVGRMWLSVPPSPLLTGEA